jgi:hypothetical protein
LADDLDFNAVSIIIHYVDNKMEPYQKLVI